MPGRPELARQGFDLCLIQAATDGIQEYFHGL
jgi:hypothetical protein